LTEKQLFGVIIRGLGVYFSALGIEQIWKVILLAFSKYEESQHDILGAFSIGLVLLAVGYILIRRPDWVIDFAYERQNGPERPPN
jgi:hypothetical protein